MKRHWDHSSSYKGKHLLGADLQFRGELPHCHQGEKQGIMQADRILESSMSGSIGSRKRDRHWAWFELLKLQSPTPVTHFLLQAHTYSSKVLPPNPCQVSPLPNDQVPNGLWGPFLSKPASNLSEHFQHLRSSLRHWVPASGASPGKFARRMCVSGFLNSIQSSNIIPWPKWHSFSTQKNFSVCRYLWGLFAFVDILSYLLLFWQFLNLAIRLSRPTFLITW